jgi:N-acetylglutamate synthase-like GNAT family acetyltransferase
MSMDKYIDIQIVDFNSELQKKSIELRTKVLREPLGLVYTTEQLAEEQHETHIVAIVDETVVGVLLLKKIDNELLKMRQVAVASDLQKTGIGKKLVLFSEDYARKNGFRKIELHARDVAKDFYLTLNYQIIGEPFTEVGIIHYKMEKSI